MSYSKTVSIGEASRICNVTAKQIRHWQEKGYISEGNRILCGERSYRQFGDRELMAIQLMKSLLDQGYTVQASAKKVKEQLKQEDR